MMQLKNGVINMQRVQIKYLKEYVGKKTTVCGWVQTIRDQGSIKFLILRDVTGTIQAVVLKSAVEAFEFLKDVSLESVVCIEGMVKEEKQAPGGIEIALEKISLLSKSYPELPIPVMSEKGGDETEQTKRFDWRWLDLRKEEKLQIFKVWTELEKHNVALQSDDDLNSISNVGNFDFTGADGKNESCSSEYTTDCVYDLGQSTN